MNKKIIAAAVALLVLVVWVISAKSNKAGGASQKEASDPQVQAQQLYQQAVEYKERKKLLEAKDTLQKIVSEYPDAEDVANIQKELEGLNLEIIFSNIPTPQTVIHEVQSGDTLGKLARKYGTTIELIKINNKLKNDIIQINQRLRIWTGKFNILVDKSQNILILKTGEDVVKVYDVSTGENNSTPVGKFKITSKLKDPVWFNRGVVVPPESPENVLGSRWLGFNLPGYGIHGTIEPETIGQQITAGCVRMRNEEVEELYSLVPEGVEVVIVD